MRDLPTIPSSIRSSIMMVTVTTTIVVIGAVLWLVADKHNLFNQPFLVWQAYAIGDGSNPQLSRKAFLRSQRSLENLLLQYHVQNSVKRGDVEIFRDEASDSSPTRYKASQRYEVASNDFSKIASISSSANNMSAPGIDIESSNPRYKVTFSDLLFGFTLILIIVAAGSFERSPTVSLRYPVGLSPPSLVINVVLLGALGSISLVNPSFNLPRLGFFLLFGSGLLITLRWLLISRKSWIQAALPLGFVFFGAGFLAIATLETINLTLTQR